MAERRPIIVDGGQLKELPVGDTVAGSSGGTATWAEIVTVLNGGDPQIVFDSNADLVTTNVA